MENVISLPGIYPKEKNGAVTVADAATDVRCINPLAAGNWDEQLKKLPGSTFFHCSAWAQVLYNMYGYAPLYFAIVDGESIQSLLPMMEVRSWITGRRGVSLPFTDDCGPLCPNETVFQNLLEHAVEYGRNHDWRYVECRGAGSFLNEVPASLSFHGHVLNLDEGEEALFGRLDDSVRRGIRKAEKCGLKVEFLQDGEALRTFYSLQCKTRKRHGLPPQPYLFFSNIGKYVLNQKLGVVAVARHRGQAVAAAVYFRFGDKAIYKYGASNEAFQLLRGNNLVMWESIKWHIRHGIKQLHLGRTSLNNEGLRRYKLGWGAVEEKIKYIKFDLRKKAFVKDADDACGWHNHVFRFLPTFASRLTGWALYKHWA